MNTTIKECAISADRIIRMRYPDVDAGVGIGLTLEKMAYLIIQECIDEAYRNGDNVLYLKKYFEDKL